MRLEMWLWELTDALGLEEGEVPSALRKKAIWELDPEEWRQLLPLVERVGLEAAGYRLLVKGEEG